MSVTTVASPSGSCPSSYDDVADAYDRLIRPKYEAVARRVVSAARAAGDLGSATVVELAAGTGALTHLLAPSVGGGYVATDVSAAMLEVARTRDLASPGLAWLTADVAALPLPDGCADLVVSSLGPVQDTPELLAEAARILRPEGRLLACTWGDDYSELQLLQAARAMLGLEQRPVTTRHDLRRRAAAAGLADVRVTSFRLRVVHPSTAAYLEYRSSFGPPPLPEGITLDDMLGALAATAAAYAEPDGRLVLGWHFWLLHAAARIPA